MSDGYTIITVHHDATEGTVTDQLRIDVEKCQQSKGRICIKDSTPTGATVKIKADGAITEVYYTGGTQCLNDEYVVGTNVSWTATTEGYTDKTGSITIVKGDNYITFDLEKTVIVYPKITMHSLFTPDDFTYGVNLEFDTQDATPNLTWKARLTTIAFKIKYYNNSHELSNEVLDTWETPITFTGKTDGNGLITDVGMVGDGVSRYWEGRNIVVDNETGPDHVVLSIKICDDSEFHLLKDTTYPAFFKNNVQYDQPGPIQ